ncbi:MAG: UTP--glucose-1-phosphate uridylyltransferase, partial [Quisquiliibacterium sp.]
MQLKKAVFPVAGLGTRVLPATKSIPKEMLPIVDRPIIQYAVDEAIEAGCDTLIFVTGRSKRAVEDYFDRAPELEAELEAKGRTDALAAVRNIVPAHVKVVFVRQPAPLGLGHAVLCARPLIGDDEHFAVLLPDDLIDGHPHGALKQMLPVAQRTGGSVLAIEQVPRHEVDRYGVIDPESEQDTVIKVRAIVEKPAVDQAPSTF